MTIFTDAFIPYEFTNKRKAYEYIVSRCAGIKKALKFIEMDNEHLIVKCPLSSEYLEITGNPDELDWVHAELTKNEWYKI